MVSIITSSLSLDSHPPRAMITATF